jgi:hypothetical protein
MSAPVLQRILKYELAQAGTTVIKAHHIHKALHAEWQYGKLVLWVEGEPEEPGLDTKDYAFYTAMTGNFVPNCGDAQYIGTAILQGALGALGDYVVHVYQIK